MMKKFLDWLDHRTGMRNVMHEALYERIPGGSRWRYVWGSTLVFTFVLQMITGFFLWTAYSPSAQTAWESVYYINEVMFLGNIVRGMHHFAAQAMVVLMALHLMQVIIDGAYKAPREINFWLGIILMQIVLGLSLTGYLLPWDQKGYYATKVSTNIASATPVVGEQVQQLVQGGSEYGHHTLTRFFALHTGLLPFLLLAFLGLHIYVFRRHGITVPDPDRAPTTTFWPDQVLKDAVACLAVLATVLFLAFYKGAELSAPANPTENYRAARPEWYFLFLFRFLKFEWVEEHGLAFGAIYVPGALMTILILMPFIALWKYGHRFNQIFAWVMCGIIIVLTGVAAYEDSNDIEHQAAIENAHIQSERVMEIAGDPHSLIPVEGAVTMLPNDPLIQGPKIFAKNCAGCHHFDKLNGQGEVVMETVKGEDGNPKPVEAKAVAADLGNFGSREWMKSVLTDYSNHFKPLKNAPWYREIQKKEEDGDEVGPYIQVDDSDMASWMEDYGKDLLESDKESIDALAEYFYGKAVEADADSRKFETPKYDKVLAKKGEGLLEEAYCMGCHQSNDYDYDVEPPKLDGYGSSDWLRSFILNPGASHNYGKKNQMPSYEGKLSDHELDMLVRWMTGDYSPTELELNKLNAQESAYTGPKEESESESKTESKEAKTDEE